MESKVTDPCVGCAIGERGCLIKNTYQKVACSCINCLVKVMCSQLCVIRFNCVEIYYKKEYRRETETLLEIFNFLKVRNDPRN
jgi:hypothetical protein